MVQTVSKTGNTVTRVQSAKEFKEQYHAGHPSATNKEIKLAFASYLRKESLGLAKGFDFNKLAVAASNGKIGLQKIGVNKSGEKATLVILDYSRNNPIEAAKAAINECTPDTLKSLLEYIRENMPAVQESSNAENTP